MLLTRLPVARLTSSHPPASDCVWAYPLVGAVVGGLGAVALLLGRFAGLNAATCAVLALAVTILSTGGLHEDGLADTADGLGGGHTREAKLAIMRDSRIGSFGALALLLSVALRAVVVATTPRPCLALCSAAILARAAMLLLLRLPPARADGLAVPLSQTRLRRIAAGLLLASPIAVVAPSAALASLCAAGLMALLAHRQLGGSTGDVLGAAEQLAECAAMVCF